MTRAKRKQSIRKDDATDAQVPPDEFELTNINVKEVSMVDAAANRRKFNITKKGPPGRSMREMETAKNAGAGAAAEPVVASAVVPTDKASWSKAEIDELPDSSFLYIEAGGKKDDDGKTEPRSKRHFPVKEADGKVDLPHLRDALARIPDSDIPDDEKKKATDKGEKLLADADKKDTNKGDEPTASAPAAAGAPPVAGPAVTKDAVVEVTPTNDGSVAVTVTTDTTPAVPPSPLPAAVADKIKEATLAGIDAIAARVAAFRAAVASDANVGSYGYGSSVLYDHTWYIASMLDSLYDIGGPQWEIEQAGDNALAKGAAIKKAVRAITAARVTKMSGIHKAMNYVCKDMGALLDELNLEQDVPQVPTDNDDTTVGDGAAVSFAKGAPASGASAAAAPAPVVKATEAAAVAPAAPAADLAAIMATLGDLQKKVNEQGETIAKQGTTIAKQAADNVALQATVEEQAATLAKARIDIQPSRKMNSEEPGVSRDNVVWQRDMAASTKNDRGTDFDHLT